MDRFRLSTFGSKGNAKMLKLPGKVRNSLKRNKFRSDDNLRPAFYPCSVLTTVHQTLPKSNMLPTGII